MKPRLPSSKKWTAFPKEYAQQIQATFREAFASQLKTCELIVEGRIYSEEILLRVGFLEKGRLKQNNFEVSINYSQKNAMESINTAIDAAASMMNEYFEQDGEADLPYSWKEYKFENRDLFLQFSTENTDLEAQANEILGIDSDDLVQEETSDEDESPRLKH